MGRLRQVLFRLAPTLLLVGLFSLGFLGHPEDSEWLNASPLWGEGDPFYWEGSRALASPLFIWRGRPNQDGSWSYYGADNPYLHNSLGLRDHEIAVPKPDGVTRILNLGDSATWGLNLADRSQTYSDQLEIRLNGCAQGDEGCDRRFDVINGGTIGYSSVQTLQYLKYALDEFDPDILTIYVGNNDPAPSGMKDADRLSATASPIQRLLHQNFFYLLLQKAWLKTSEGDRGAGRAELTSKMARSGTSEANALRNRADYYDSMARVSPSAYEQNLREMVAAARAHGTRVIFLKVPMNLVWPRTVNPSLELALRSENLWIPVYNAPDYLAAAHAERPPCETPLLSHPYLCRLSAETVARAFDPDGDGPLDQRQERKLLSMLRRRSQSAKIPLCQSIHMRGSIAVALAALDRLPEARSEIEGAVRDWQSMGSCNVPRMFADLTYTLGVIRLLDGEPDAAFEALRRSRELWPFAMSPDYEQRFDDVVADLDVEWIDLPGRFREVDPDFFGSALIHDWVHPDRRGNRVIADAIYEKVAGDDTAEQTATGD